MDSPKLLPCPFCGGEASLEYRSWETRDAPAVLYASCDECFAETGDGDADEAASQWNRRPSPWISVEERLPEEGEEVLGMTMFGAQVVTRRDDDRWFIGPSWWPVGWIVKWSPLPEPPEER